MPQYKWLQDIHKQDSYLQNVLVSLAKQVAYENQVLWLCL